MTQSPTAFSRRTMTLGLGATLVGACTAPQTSPDETVKASSTALDTAGWRDGPALPFAVQEIYPAAFGDAIHLAGGFVAENGQITGPTDRHVALDLVAGTWSDQTPLPVARHHPQLIAFQDRLIALAGFETQNAEAIWVMQAGGWSWAPGEAWKAMPNLPHPLGEAITAILGAQLHIAGGRQPAGEANAGWSDHTDTDAHFVLADLSSRTWETAAPLPTARNSAAAALIGSNWHVVSGRTVGEGNTGAHEVYDLREDRWRSLAPMPQGQGGLAAASVGDKLYAFGGEFFAPAPGGVYAESWAYDPVADAWTAIANMPNPRHGLGAVAIDTDIYVIGGALEVGGSQTSALVEIYRP